MKVCIAEKPSVAKEIAEIVGAKNRRDGFFEGNGYCVTWTFGHLCGLKEPHDYSDRWKSWNYSSLPIIPKKFGIKLIGDGGITKQFNTIKSLVDKATEVINCGDAGIEGELIQRWVLLKCECKVPIKRLWISSLTEEAIRDGFNNLMEGTEFDSLYHAGMARSIGDWILGINATRLYTLKYGGHGSVLSIGRVQTPTLALVVKRCLEIEKFEPQPYWELKTVYRDVTFSVKTGRFDSPEKAELQLSQIKGEMFKITNVSIKKGKDNPPKLFDLTSLQVECNKKFGYTADETLRYIQSLYEKKLTTYPRVDTTFLPTDMYPKVPSILKGLKDYTHFTSSLLSGEKIKRSKMVFNDKKITDHHAIIPTGQHSISLNRQEQSLFNLICLRFIAQFYPECQVSNSAIEGAVSKIPFKATGKQILSPGWRVVIPSSSNDKDNVLPTFTIGEEGPHEPSLAEKHTQPPNYYTEATLLRAMEGAGKEIEDDELKDMLKENGIGRPSTRANIIETLFKRSYLKREKKRVLSTPTGDQLIGLIGNELLKSAELTGRWEKRLKEIENNQFSAGQFVDQMKVMVKDLTFEVMNSSKRSIVEDSSKPEKKTEKKRKTKEDPNTPQKCPKCGDGDMIKGKAAWGCSLYAKGCKTVIPFVVEEKKLTSSQIKDLINKGKTRKLKGFTSSEGVKVDGVIHFNSTTEWKILVKYE